MKRRAFLNQYKLIFLLAWIVSYIVYPSWALPVSETTRHLIFLGLLTCFAISLFLLDRWLSALNIDKPFIILPESWMNIIRDHSGLVAVCLIAVALHISPILQRPILIIGDETLHLYGGLWIYNFVDSTLHKYFQIVFWLLVGSVIIFSRLHLLRDYLSLTAKTEGNRSFKYLVIIIFGLAVVYYLLFKDWPYYPRIIRYPPLSRLMYFTLYSAFGINHLWPRILQVVFYILGSIYIYRTILLYGDDHTALLGASIYPFLPVMFLYAGLAELGCGTVFFIIAISYYFLRYIKNGDSRDIILASFLIGTGFLYKRPIFLMTFICSAYLMYSWMKNRDVNLSISMKIILLSLVPIIPWMIIGKFFTWRNYKIVMSNFIPPHGKVFTYLSQLPSDISWLLFILFIGSIIYILMIKKSHLSLFFLLLFIAFYFFFAIDMAGRSPRLSMAFYPAISVFTALFISFLVNKIRLKHAFRVVYLLFLFYLITICAVPPLNARYLKSAEFIKLEDYPSKEAMQWVRDNVHEGERVLTIRIMTALFYRDKYKIDKDKIVDFWYEIDEISTPERLRQFCIENKITYVVFPYGAVYNKYFPILRYLYENRDNEFIKVKEYNIGENYIYIYKSSYDLSYSELIGGSREKKSTSDFRDNF